MKIQTNRLKTRHVDVNVRANNSLDFKLLSTFSRNWGRHNLTFTAIKDATSLLLEANDTPTKLEGWEISASLAADRGTIAWQ